jgi:hypothetical protein
MMLSRIKHQIIYQIVGAGGEQMDQVYRATRWDRNMEPRLTGINAVRVELEVAVYRQIEQDIKRLYD